MIVLWLVGAGVWLAAVCTTCAVLSAAKRADAALASPSGTWASGSIADFVGPYARALLGGRADSVVVTLQQSREAGQVVVVAAYGAAAGQVGRVLPPDDFVTGMATLTGRCERRERAAAVPLRLRGETIGAIGLTVPAGGSPLVPAEMACLVEAADALSLQLSALRAAPAYAARAISASDISRPSAAAEATRPIVPQPLRRTANRVRRR